MLGSIGSVQERERETRRETNRLNHERRQLNKKLCRRVLRPQERRQTNRRQARILPPQSDNEVYTTLLEEVAGYAEDIKKQILLIETSGIVRWTVETPLGLNGDEGKVRRYRLQIRASEASPSWNDWLIVKSSGLPSAGLGLFAARDMHKGQVVSLYGGNCSKLAPLNVDYTIQGDKKTFFLDAVGSMGEGNRPFLGAHMANDPNHSSAAVDKDRCNCTFDPDQLVVLSKDVEKGSELLVDYYRESDDH